MKKVTSHAHARPHRRKAATGAAVSAPGLKAPRVDDPADRYDELESIFRTDIAGLSGPLFTTTAAGLFDLFLAGLPEHRRQHYNCHSCRRFVDKFGGLATIDAAGALSPVFWKFHPAGGIFENSVALVRSAVSRSAVSGVFLFSDKTWGEPRTGEWTHLSGQPPMNLVFHDKLMTAGQKAAEKIEDFGMLKRALVEYPKAVADEALRVLAADVLTRSEKVKGPAEWLAKLHASLVGIKGKTRDNLIWRAVAAAPPGFCHVKTTMVNTLLDDIVAGLPFETIRRRFAEKMHPLQYQRPTAAPTLGNIQRAEEVMEKLGVVASLRRRFARLEDLETIWTPKAPEAPAASGGIFDHLKPKAAPPVRKVALPPVTCTLEKFLRDFLPAAESIEYLTPSSSIRSNYCAFVTAADPSAPNLLQWNNPVSSYVYNMGSTNSAWGLLSNVWVKVNALARGPHEWGGQTLPHHGASLLLILDGARDIHYQKSGGMFPGTMRAEYREIRSTLEAYFMTAAIEGKDEATACGLNLVKSTSGKTWGRGIQIRVNGSDVYILDRWE